MGCSDRHLVVSLFSKISESQNRNETENFLNNFHEQLNLRVSEKLELSVLGTVTARTSNTENDAKTATCTFPLNFFRAASVPWIVLTKHARILARFEDKRRACTEAILYTQPVILAQRPRLAQLIVGLVNQNAILGMHARICCDNSNSHKIQTWTVDKHCLENKSNQTKLLRKLYDGPGSKTKWIGR